MIRQPAVAGRFYPGTAEGLNAFLDRTLIGDANRPARAIIAPTRAMRIPALPPGVDLRKSQATSPHRPSWPNALSVIPRHLYRAL
jgi:predicted class III extradiol MEMO1 family dioxygenase